MTSQAIIAQLDAAAEERWRTDPWSAARAERRKKSGRPQVMCSRACRLLKNRLLKNRLRKFAAYHGLRRLPIYTEPCRCRGGRNYGCLHHGGGR